MSTTVLEALQNAQVNFEYLGKTYPMVMRELSYSIGTGQLKNAIEALENGKPADFVIQDQMFGDINK